MDISFFRHFWQSVVAEAREVVGGRYTARPFMLATCVDEVRGQRAISVGLGLQDRRSISCGNGEDTGIYMTESALQHCRRCMGQRERRAQSGERKSDLPGRERSSSMKTSVYAAESLGMSGIDTIMNLQSTNPQLNPPAITSSSPRQTTPHTNTHLQLTFDPARLVGLYSVPIGTGHWAPTHTRHLRLATGRRSTTHR